MKTGVWMQVGVGYNTEVHISPEGNTGMTGLRSQEKTESKRVTERGP